MTAARFMPLLGALLSLAACGTQNLQTAALKMTGITQSTAHLAAKPGAAERRMGLIERGVQFPINLIETYGEVEIWAAPEGPQVFLKDEMLLGTRGFGPDLMSAQTPTLAMIRAKSRHSRSYTVLDGTDSLNVISFDCFVETAPDSPDGLSLDEVCTSAKQVIRNRYVFGPEGSLLASRQWLNARAGFAIIE